MNKNQLSKNWQKHRKHSLSNKARKIYKHAPANFNIGSIFFIGVLLLILLSLLSPLATPYYETTPLHILSIFILGLVIIGVGSYGIKKDNEKQNAFDETIKTYLSGIKDDEKINFLHNLLKEYERLNVVKSFKDVIPYVLTCIVAIQAIYFASTSIKFNELNSLIHSNSKYSHDEMNKITHAIAELNVSSGNFNMLFISIIVVLIIWLIYSLELSKYSFINSALNDKIYELMENNPVEKSN